MNCTSNKLLFYSISSLITIIIYTILLSNMNSFSSELHHRSPMEKDPRYLELVNEYAYTKDTARAQYRSYAYIPFSILISPLSVLYTSMQLSVESHLTIYGDVKESEVQRPQRLRKMLGFKAKATTSSKALIKAPLELQIHKAPRADLIKASG